MSTKKCPICQAEIDSRGYTQHVRKCKEEHENLTPPNEPPENEAPKIPDQISKPIKEVLQKTKETVEPESDEVDDDEEFEIQEDNSWMWGLLALPIIILAAAAAFLMGGKQNE